MLLALLKALVPLIRIHVESVLEKYWYVVLVEGCYHAGLQAEVQVEYLKTKVADLLEVAQVMGDCS